jgi:AraC-like DNA-binding protein/quercetin dioxygenase-like cupin family protein
MPTSRRLRKHVSETCLDGLFAHDRVMKKTSFVIQRVGGKFATAVQARSVQSFARHTHDEYGVGVIIAGAQRSWSGRGAVEAGVGDLITVNPGEVHDGAPIGESRAWAMLYISPARMTAIVSDIGEGRRADMEFTDPVVRDRRAAARFASAYVALISGEEDATEERLMLLVANMLHGSSALRPFESNALASVKERIDDDPAGHHPLDALAHDARASRFQTLRSFVRLTGLTPHAYVVQRRLDAARSMIRRGAALADAAIAAGFADQSHFHRSFTQRYGMTPGVYATAMR